MKNLYHSRKESPKSYPSIKIWGALLFIILQLPVVSIAQKQKEIELIVECVEYIGDDMFEANFGYNNPNKNSVIVPEGDSYVVYNKGQAKKNAITTFESGRQYNVFKQIFRKDDYCEWTLIMPDGTTKTKYSDINSAHCVTGNSDIEPYYDPPPGGLLQNSLIYPELYSLKLKYDEVNDPNQFVSDNIFQIRDGNSGDKEVLIEVLSSNGQYANMVSILTNQYDLDVVRENEEEFTVIGWLPIPNLFFINDHPAEVKFARPVYPVVTHGGVINDGDFAQRSYYLREAFKVNIGGEKFDIDGSGVKVGVLSDSFNKSLGFVTAENDIASGDIPGPGYPPDPDNPDDPGYTTPVDLGGEGNPWEFQYGSASDEGRAILQIIHDVAPGAKLAFRTAFNNYRDFADGILDLEAAGCDVIVDDVSYITEPFFEIPNYGLGPVNEAIEEVTTIKGVSYFTSGGNFNSFSHEDVFTPITTGNNKTRHNFGGGDFTQKILLEKGSYVMVLQWKKPHASIWGVGSDIDLNWYLTDDDGNILYGFNTDKNFNGDPVEVMPFTVVSNVAYTNIMIENVTNSEPVPFKYVVFRAGEKGVFTVIDGSQKGNYTIVGHADNEYAMTVGASPWKIDPLVGVRTMERFSSTGRTGSSKPDFTAPDGVNNTFLGVDTNIDTDDEDPGKYPNFFGTSAAAPNAAAVAALLLDAKNKFYNAVTGPTEEEDIRGEISPEGMRTLLQTTAQDIGDDGFDNSSGAGFIQADAALLELANPSPDVEALLYDDDDGNIVPGQIQLLVTVKGNYMTDDTKVSLAGQELTITDRISTNEDSYYEELQVLVPAYGDGNPEFIVNTPPKGDLGLDGGFDAIRFEGNPVDIYVLGDVYNNSANSFSNHYGERMPGISPVFLLKDVWDEGDPPVATLSPELITKLTDAINFEINPIDGTDFTYLSPPGSYTVVASTTYEDDSPLAQELAALGITIRPRSGQLNRLALPITVKANNLAGPTALTYGDPINITYTYSWDESLYNIHEDDVSGLMAEIAKAHTYGDNGKNIINDYVVVFSAGRPFLDRLPFLNRMPFLNVLVTQSILNAGKPFLNTFGVNNGQDIIDISALVDSFEIPETPEFDEDYEVNFQEVVTQQGTQQMLMVEAEGALFNRLPFLNRYPFLNIGGEDVFLYEKPYANRMPFLNRLPFLNGSFLEDGTFTNRLPFLNQDSEGDGYSSFSNAFVIIDETDFINAGIDQPMELLPVNVITGIGVTPHTGYPDDDGNMGQIFPAALISDYFVVTLEPGNLEILPAPIQVTFDDEDNDDVITTIYTGQPQIPAITATAYSDDPADYPSGTLPDLSGFLQLKYYNDSGTELPGPPVDAGTYTVTVEIIDDPGDDLLPNYRLESTCTECDVTVLFNIEKADLTVWANDAEYVYCDPAINSTCPDLSITFNYDGFKTREDGTVETAADVFVQGYPYYDIKNENDNLWNGDVGSYLIIPSYPPNEVLNYNIVVPDVKPYGILTVTPAPATVTITNTEHVYDGLEKRVTVTTDPPDVVLYDVMYTIPGETDPLTELPVNAGTYNVTVTLNGNYNGFAAGTLTVDKASLTLEALDVYVDYGNVPVYEYSLTGFVPGEDEQSVFGGEEVLFTPDPSDISEWGEYTITPSLHEPANYYIDPIINGTLYVNEIGNGLKKIRTYLDCVVNNSDDPEYPLIARFFYENTNDFDIYIEPGVENYLISEGTYELIEPVPNVFYAGGGIFEVAFDGNKLTWVVISFDSNSGHKTSVSTDASSTSGRCSTAGARIADSSLGTANAESMEDELLFQNGSIVIYPNPVKDKFIIRFAGEQEKVQDIFLFDSQGKYHILKAHWITSENGYEVDLSQMNSGLYLIKLDLENSQQIYRVIKE